MLTDKQIEREEAFCEDWYMNRKMEKTPTYADAIAWADKTMIEKATQWLKEYGDDFGVPESESGRVYVDDLVCEFRKAMEE